MSDLSKKLKGLRDHTPSIHSSTHHHHHHHHKNENSATVGTVNTREEDDEAQLVKWAEEAAREDLRDRCRNR
jgi:hypothetical protein